jgi:acyl-CoA synthetase (NDP forming)
MSEDYEQTLKIASKKHDITGIRVYDIREEKMPDLWFLCLMPKRAVELINTSAKEKGMNYEKQYHDKVN